MSTVALGRASAARRGWWAAHRFLIWRRISQAMILALFLSGPLFGVWLVKGNLAASLTLDLLPLTDPLLLAQSLLTGQLPEANGFIGALLVVLFYLLVGGRVYCSWVCPVNPVTDAAAWLHQRLGINRTARFARHTRYLLLALVLLLALGSGTLAWEAVNPVSLTFRALVFGMGAAWVVVAALFLFDLAVSRRGWCGHLCPVGAFYSLLGRPALLRVSAAARERCNDCMECYAVCPEPQVLRPALKGEAEGRGPLIDSGDCTHCGRCIDICSERVFRFGHRFEPNHPALPRRS